MRNDPESTMPRLDSSDQMQNDSSHWANDAASSAQNAPERIASTTTTTTTNATIAGEKIAQSAGVGTAIHTSPSGNGPSAEPPAKSSLKKPVKKKGFFGTLGSAWQMFQGKPSTTPAQESQSPIITEKTQPTGEPVLITDPDVEPFPISTYTTSPMPTPSVNAPQVNAVAAVEPTVAESPKVKVSYQELESLEAAAVDRLASDITQCWLDDGGNVEAIQQYQGDEEVILLNGPEGQKVEAGANMMRLLQALGRAAVEHYFFNAAITGSWEDQGNQAQKDERLEQLKRRMLQGQDPETTPEETLPVHASISYRVSSDKMRFSIMVKPPLNGGEDITLERLMEYLKGHEIRYGVLDFAVQDLADNKRYEVWTDVAIGKEPVHGINGSIEELYPRQIKLELKEKSDGSIDFKEINTIQTVDKGAVLCNITLPTPGEDGMTVYGSLLKGRNGLAAVIPAGENTVLNEDKTQLLANTDGSLVFRGGKFHVEPVLRLENVDASTGNIHFNGDVVVRGRVQEGYQVRCKGNIKVEGIVEGADIEAGGSILLVHGINGMGKGILVAKKEITAKFIESCTVSAGGKIKAETVVNSTLETDEGLEISGAKGRIVGGSITSFGSIKARRIGARSAVPTTITLGVTPSIIKQKTEIEHKVDAMAKELDHIIKNLAFLEQQQEMGRQLSPDHVTILQQLRLQLPVQKMKFSHLKKTLEELEGKMETQRGAQLIGQRIYPPTKVNIGRSSLITRDVHENARIYMNSEGEIVIGSA